MQDAVKPVQRSADDESNIETYSIGIGEAS
jgi:hypothetical protein